MKKKLLSTLLAVCTASCLFSTSAFAAEHTVSTGDEFTEAFNSDTDSEVIIHIADNIEGIDDLLSNKDQVYTIEGNGYQIKSLVYVTGEGKVIINADINSEDDGGLDVVDRAEVTVNGSIESYYCALYIYDEAKVTVTGNVTSETDYGIGASDSSQIEVQGNVSSKEEGALWATDNAQVTVGGNVTGASGDESVKESTDPDYTSSDGSNGVEAYDNAQVTVGGNVTGGDGYGDSGCGGDGIQAYGSAIVTVGGNVTGGSVDTGAQQSDDCSWAGDGIEMDSTASVYVTGNVTGGDTNDTNGVAGSGVYICLVSAEKGMSTRSGGENEKSAGTLYVEGTITGGAADGEDAVSGAGIYYDADEVMSVETLEPLSVEELLEEPIEDVLGTIYEGCYKDIIYLCRSMGYTAEQRGKKAHELSDAIEKIMAQYIGDATDEESMIRNLEALDVADKTALYTSVIDRYTTMVEELILEAVNEGAYLPTVTLWKVEAGGEDELPVFSDIDGGSVASLAKGLNNLHNYIIHVMPGTNGTVACDKDTANPGETVTINAVPADGYQVSRVLVSGEEIKAVDGIYSFTMPEYGDVEISAEFVQEDPKTSDPVTPTTNADIPKMGDDAASLLWIVMLIAALGGVVYTVSMKKKMSR